MIARNTSSPKRSQGTIEDRRRATVSADKYVEGRMYWVQWRCEGAEGNSRYYPIITKKTETHLEWSWLDQLESEKNTKRKVEEHLRRSQLLSAEEVKCVEELP